MTLSQTTTPEYACQYVRPDLLEIMILSIVWPNASYPILEIQLPEHASNSALMAILPKIIQLFAVLHAHLTHMLILLLTVALLNVQLYSSTSTMQVIGLVS